jgi:formate-dependent nitrite reductase membrane component NrfD
MGLQTVWSWLPAIYLFLGGLSAGVFVTVALISVFTGDRFQATVRFGAWASALCAGCGSAVLLLDVGQPLRAVVLFKSFVNPNSWMTVGAWLLFGAIALDGLFALLWTDRVLKWLHQVLKPFAERITAWRVLVAIVGIPVSLGVATYTGLLLGSLPFRPFWYTWILPALFVASALDTGLGLTTVYASLWEKGKGVEKLRTVLEVFVLILIAAESVVLVYYFNTMLAGPAEAARSAQMLLSGTLSPVFWGVIVCLGLGVPFFVCVSQLTGLLKNVTKVVPAIGISCCLVGGFTLRLAVLLVGIPASLSSPALLQILNGIRFSP